MAESQGWARRTAARLNPITRLREGASNFGAHPIQNSISALLGLAGSAFGGPLAGQALRRGSGALFDRGNDRRFDQGARELQQGSQQAIGAGVPWGITGPLSGMQGNSPGMPGITSPNTQQGRQNQRSPLADMLGLPDYANGNNGNLPDSQSPQGSTAGQIPTLPPVSVSPPSNTVGNVTAGGARDAFAGTSGSSDWGNTFQTLGMLGSQGGGGDRSDIGHFAMNQAIQQANNSGDPNRTDWASRMRQQLIQARQNDGR